MRNRGNLAVVVLFGILSFAACTFGTGPVYTTHKLPSGKEIKIVGTGKMWSTNQETTMTLKYITDLPMNDENALREEILEVWDAFRPAVEKEGLNRAIITAQSPPKGFIFTVNTTRGYGFTKNSEGEWEMM